MKPPFNHPITAVVFLVMCCFWGLHAVMALVEHLRANRKPRNIFLASGGRSNPKEN